MQENKVLILKHKKICGKDFYYPDNQTSKTLLSITRSSSGKRKAFTETDLEKLKSLGYEFKILHARVIYE